MSPNKMERFSPAAQRVLALAQEAAERFQNTMIGTEHLLLALVTEDDGFAGQALRSFEIEPVRLMQSVKQRTDGKLVPDSAPALASDTKQTLAFAVDEAHQMGYDHIGTEHLLLALLRQSDCAAAEMLKDFVIDFGIVRDEISRVLENKPSKIKVTAIPSPISPPNPRPSTFRSQGIENLLLKILSMVGENKLTSEQGIELLSAFFPPFTLQTGETMRSICQFITGGALKENEARIVINNEKRHGRNFEQVMWLGNLLNYMSLGFIIQSALRDQSITLELSDGKITFHVEYRLAEDAP